MSITPDIVYTIYATELSVLSYANPFSTMDEIRALALKVLARSQYQPAVELMNSRPDFVRLTTESEKQVESIINSNEYRERVAPTVEREIVTITTVVTIISDAGEVTVTSETTTKHSQLGETKTNSTSPLGEVTTTDSTSPIRDSRDRLEEMIAKATPMAQGLIREKIDVDTEVLTSNNEKPYKRNYNSRVKLAAYIDGYKDGMLIERKQRMKKFTIGDRYKVPRYDVVQMGVILYVTEESEITLYETLGTEVRTQVFREIDISKEVDIATSLLDSCTSDMSQFTPRIVEMALQRVRKY